MKYAELLVSPGATLGVVVLAAAGAALLLRRQPRLALLLLSFPVTFALFIANTVPASRYLNPVLPVVALLAAHAAVAACRLSRHPRLVATAMALALLPSATARSVEVGRFFAQPDTRTLARGVIEATAPSGSTILIQPVLRAAVRIAGRLGGGPHGTGRLARGDLDAVEACGWRPHPGRNRPTDCCGWERVAGRRQDYVAPGDLRADPIASLRALGVGFVVLKRFDVPDPNVAWLARRAATRGRLVASILPYRRRPPSAPSAPFLHNTDALITADLARPGPTSTSSPCRRRARRRYNRRLVPGWPGPSIPCLNAASFSSIRRWSTVSPSRGRAAARSAKKCLARPSRPTRWRWSPRCCAIGAARAADRPDRRPRSRDALIARLAREGFMPDLIVFPSTTPTLDADAREMAKLKAALRRAAGLLRAARLDGAAESMACAPEVDAMIVGEPEDGSWRSRRWTR